MGSRPRQGGISDQGSLPTAPPIHQRRPKSNFQLHQGQPKTGRESSVLPTRMCTRTPTHKQHSLQQECLPQPLFES